MGDVVRAALLVDCGDGRRLAHLGAHAVLVVLHQEDHRQLPEGRQVHRLVEVADIGGAFAQYA